MATWVNRTVLSGSSVDPNGTTSHTCTFTAAASGNFLVAVIAGAVTSSTPSGWTLLTSAVNFTGLYVFTKTAGSGESSFSTTHNASNYAIRGIVYEFYNGSSALNANSATGQALNTGVNGPQVTGLTGTYTRFSARAVGSNRGDTTFDCVWTLPSVEDYDGITVGAATDGIGLAIAYDDSSTGSSFNPSSNLAVTNTGYASGEGIAFALSVTLAQQSPSVTTNPVTNIGATSADGNGSVDSDGNSTITERGFCWSTSVDPTTAGSKVTSSGTTGAYSATMTGLTAGTLYYVRAYAINAVGTAYGNNKTFRYYVVPLNWISA